MAQVINTNVASLESQRQLNKSKTALSTSLERLSSGLRINSAKDDAAGMAISDRMTSQISGLNQAVSNSNDGISLAQTAESALSTITDNLQRIRVLSVQSANATNSSSDRASIQAEVTQLSDEITRVAKDTQFNGINLLDGTFSNQTFQVGANAGQTITVDSVSSAKATSLGAEVLSADGTAMGVATTAAASATAVANGVAGYAAGAATALQLTTAGGTTGEIVIAAGADAAVIANKINAASGGIGITATATNSTKMNGLTLDGDLSFNIGTTAISAKDVTTGDYTNLVTAINAKASTTGITASFTNSGQTNDITLTSSDGRDIAISNFTSTTASTEINFGDSATTDTQLVTGAANASTKTGTVSLTSTQGTITTTNAESTTFAGATAAGGVVESSLSSVASISVLTAAGATSAISVVDAALAAVDTARGALGAVQNRFTSVVSNLESSSENASASRSRIQDADFAAETAAMSKNNILQQAGTAMLAQANSLPQQVLTLLK